MRLFGRVRLALGGVLCILAAAEAHADIRWIASNGSGTVCSRALPCGTLTQAISTAGPGDEIRCVDGVSGVGGFTISKPLAINCEDHPLSLFASTIFINVGSGDAVKLRGLNLEQGRVSFGQFYSIDFAGAGLLVLDKVQIKGATGGGGGVDFRPNGAAKLVMTDCLIADNGSSGNILIRPTGNASVKASIDRVTTAGGSLFGVKADGSGQSGGVIDVEVRDSVAASHTNNGYIAASDAGQAQIRFKITRSSASGNGAFGAVASGAQAFMIVGGSSLTGNATGLAQLSGSTVASYGNNEINFNTTNTSGTITPIALK